MPFLIAVRNQLTHGELTGVVIDDLTCYLSINMTSTLERTLWCGHVGNRLPSFDLHIWHREPLVTFESLIRGAAVF